MELTFDIVKWVTQPILLLAVLVAGWNYLFGPRVIRLLVNRYLRKRRIAWVSLIAVTLCTAMVIVIISVMGGWLRMFKESFHNMTGDIVVSRQSLTGFPYYQEMIDQINKLDGVKMATPQIRTFGLVNIGGQIQLGVGVVGLKLEEMEHVSKFRESLYRQYLMAEDTEHKELQAQGRELRNKTPTWDKPLPAEVYKDALPRAKVDVSKWPGMIVGVGVVGIHKDPETGKTTGRENLYGQDGRVPLGFVRLTVLGMNDTQRSVNAEAKTERDYWIVDDSRTKIWQYDENTVYVPLELLQKDLQMDARPGESGNPEDAEPARVTDIRVGVKDGYDIQAVKPRVQQIVSSVLQAHGMGHLAVPRENLDYVRVQSWEQVNAKFLGAVEKEKVLVTGLFGLVSVVAIFLIFCIFFMIVVEKTRDIGIVKSIGATSRGIAWIFLSYGMTIGVVGGGLGLLFGYLVVHNINEIHTWLGTALGVKIWDPETYAFDIIPNTMNPHEVAVIVIIAIESALIGALIPALRAARLHPVEALRWE